MCRQLTEQRSVRDPALLDITDADLELFEATVGNFVPPDAFDAHAHWYDLRHIVSLGPDDEPFANPEVGYDAMVESMTRWMGSRVITKGLYFPFPMRDLDCPAANHFLADQLQGRPECRGLMMIRPQDDPDRVERELLANGFAGFKVYHCFANREKTFYAEQGEFLPEWAWEMADRHGLWITMHMVLARALSDPQNAQYIREQCQKYPNARLVLAHAARGFNANHTVNAIDEMGGLDNVFFDTSGICEPTAMEAIIRATGTTRLMYGSDFPVSELRGLAFSVGDGFMWIYHHNPAWDAWEHGQANPVGLESLIALKQACRTMCLTDTDIERIFHTNARQLLGIDAQPTGELVQQQYHRSQQIIPGGTQLLPERPGMFAPDPWPAYCEQAIGCEVIDTSGRRFIDMSLDGAPACILGYADPDVNAAVIRRVHLGPVATQQTHDEVHLAEMMLDIHPWAEMARFLRAGGEAMAVAVRLAREATGRNQVATCGDHGWPDGLPFTYNRLDQLEEIIAYHKNDLAAIVMEPTGQTDPEPGFLEGVRDLANRSGAKFIFDEISIGWRLCLGGAHLKFGVEPDMAVFAETISNGFATGAVIGTRETMNAAQSPFLFNADWTDGIGPAAAVAVVRKMQRIDVPAHLATIGSRMLDGWRDLGERFNVAVTTGNRPELVSLGFDHPNANSLQTLFTIRMLDHGFLASAGFNPTLAHQPRHVDAYLAAAKAAFKEIAESIEQNDVLQRIEGKTKQTTFTRLTD